MVEVMVAATLFAAAAAGIFAAVSVTTAPDQQSDERLGAVRFGEKAMEDLRVKLDVNAWDGVEFSNGLHALSPDGIYTGNYTVETVGNLRKVTVQVGW